MKLNVRYLLRIGLIIVLIGSLRHVAWGFGTLEQEIDCYVLIFNVGPCNVFWGYFQAIAIDMVIFALAYAIEWRRRNNLSVTWYWVGIAAFVFVSAFANLFYGLVHSNDLPISKSWPVLVKIMSAIIPFVFSGILPLLLVYISHIVSSDSDQANKADGLQFAAPEVRQVQAAALLGRWEQEHGTRTPTVGWLRSQFEQVTGSGLPVGDADQAIVVWRSDNGINGRRPKEE